MGPAVWLGYLTRVTQVPSELGVEPHAADRPCVAQRVEQVSERPPTVVPIDRSVIDSEQEMADTFSDNDLLPGAVDVSEYFTSEFNDYVSDQAAKAGQAPGGPPFPTPPPPGPGCPGPRRPPPWESRTAPDASGVW